MTRLPFSTRKFFSRGVYAWSSSLTLRAGQMFGLHFAVSSSSPSNSSLQTRSQVGVGRFLSRTTSALSVGWSAEASKRIFSSPSATTTFGNGHGQCGHRSCHHAKSMTSRSSMTRFSSASASKIAFACRVFFGLSEVESNVVGAICNRVSNLDIALRDSSCRERGLAIL